MLNEKINDEIKETFDLSDDDLNVYLGITPTEKPEAMVKKIIKENTIKSTPRSKLPISPNPKSSPISEEERQTRNALNNDYFSMVGIPLNEDENGEDDNYEEEQIPQSKIQPRQTELSPRRKQNRNSDSDGFFETVSELLEVCSSPEDETLAMDVLKCIINHIKSRNN